MGESGPAGTAAPARRGTGELEAAVLAALREAGSPLFPGQVLDRLGGRLAYTTVVTTMSRLQAKGILQRRKAGRAYQYELVIDGPGLAARQMTRVLDGEPDRQAVLARFVSGLPGRDEELLRQMLAGPPAGGAG